MSWSTREIADLAGTSLRAVRHYHEVGLLDEPERASNGYKQYGVAHLVRVLRIKCLTDLGFSLSQIAAMGDQDEHPHEALRTLDAELAASIERLQRTRAELGVILNNQAPTDLPAELAPAAAEAELTDADRSFMVVLTRVLGPLGMASYSDLLADMRADAPVSSRDPVSAFDRLPADAEESVRRDIADRMVPYVRDLYSRYPGLKTAGADAPHGSRFASETVGKAIIDLYNAAQVDVIARVQVMLRAD
nr:MerR family transcriptional regulator [Rhodococcus sp. (in: high G+C Gram-positive bacteria)]